MTDNKIAIMRKHSDNIMRYGDTIYELDKDIANAKDELTELLNARSNQKRGTNEAYQAQDRILAVELQDMLTKYTPEKIFATKKLQIAVFGCEMNVELDDDTTVEDIVKDTKISPFGMAMFIMHFVEGTSTADIADSLGLLPHRVNKQIHKVLTKIVDGKIKRLVYVYKGVDNA